MQAASSADLLWQMLDPNEKAIPEDRQKIGIVVNKNDPENLLQKLSE